VDLIVGGPPCQAFSTAGKRSSFKDQRGNVFLTFIDLITQIRPKYAVIENVRGLLSASLVHRPHNLRGKGHPSLSEEEQPGGALRYIIRILESAGYGISASVRWFCLFSLYWLRPPHLETGKPKRSSTQRARTCYLNSDRLI
jgi:site-specific DNA-cytosine methylase